MTTIKRWALWGTFPVILCLVLTVVGVATGFVPLIGFSGLFLFLTCFLLFALADRILIYARKLDEYLQRKGHTRTSSPLFTEAVSLLGHLPVQFAVLIRAGFLSLGFWLIGFYESLCDGGLHALFDFENWQAIPLKMAFVLGAASLDVARHKTIKNPGILTRANTIWGAVVFFKSFIVLVAATHNIESFRAMKSFFSYPIWFLEPALRGNIFNFTLSVGLVFLVLFFLILPLSIIVMFVRGFSSADVDGKNFLSAAILVCCWVLTLPLYVIYMLLQHNAMNAFPNS